MCIGTLRLINWQTASCGYFSQMLLTTCLHAL